MTSPTLPRIHIALPVTDLTASSAFYQALFGEPPTKQKPEFIKFAPAQVALNLSLNLRDVAPTITISPAHFGVEVGSLDELEKVKRRLTQSRTEFAEEPLVDCCYAKQSKIWVQDPQQNSWEVYVIEEADVPDYACDCGSSSKSDAVQKQEETSRQC